jgi:hypothetical protein
MEALLRFIDMFLGVDVLKIFLWGAVAIEWLLVTLLLIIIFRVLFRR